MKKCQQTKENENVDRLDYRTPPQTDTVSVTHSQSKHSPTVKHSYFVLDFLSFFLSLLFTIELF